MRTTKMTSANALSIFSTNINSHITFEKEVNLKRQAEGLKDLKRIQYAAQHLYEDTELDPTLRARH